MKINLSILGKEVLDDLRSIGVEAERLGCIAYLVGGVVRDLLLRRESSDRDIVVEGNAVHLAKAIAAARKAKVTVYDQFGTATVIFLNGPVLDFATARSEHYPHPGALPVVKPGSIAQDLFRRDFTVNALAVVLNAHRFGEVRDLYAGYEDLKKKRIRVLHEKSFIDDPTRILRGVRFETRFGFRLETKTLVLLKAALKHHAPLTVKPPRYFAEFRKIFSEPRPVLCLRRIALLKGLDFFRMGFCPDWPLLARAEKTITKLKADEFYRAKDWSRVFLLAFLAKFSQKDLESFVARFHLTKEERFSLSGLAEVRQIEDELKATRLSPGEIYEVLDPVDLEIIYFIRAATSVNIVACRVDEFLKKWRLVALEITGEDLKSLGFKPGRPMGALLHILLLKKINGEIKDHRGEMAAAISLGVGHQRS